MTKKEKLYVAGQFCISVSGLAWFQTLNNDPALAKGHDATWWTTMLICSSVIVIGNVVMTWLSYLSDPKQGNPTPTKE